MYRGGEEAPEPYGSWMDKMLKAASDTVESAELVMRRASEFKPAYPTLTPEQISDMERLWQRYLDEEKSFYYYWDAVPNTYAEGRNPYDENGRTPMSCATFVQMIWSGISPTTFVGKSGRYDGTIVTAFDWGYDFKFPLRKASGLRKRVDDESEKGTKAELVDFVQPYGGDDYRESYSANTYYVSEGSDREDGQHFASYLGGASMAQELYILGCEIPMSEIMPGDMLFFRSPSLSDAHYDPSERKSFRNISHLAICCSTEHKKDGHIGIVECGGFHGADDPFLEFGMNAPHNTEIVHYADLANRICMVARHPAAFFTEYSKVGEKFEER